MSTGKFYKALRTVRQTDKLIAILCTPTEIKVNKLAPFGTHGQLFATNVSAKCQLQNVSANFRVT